LPTPHDLQWKWQNGTDSNDGEGAISIQWKNKIPLTAVSLIKGYDIFVDDDKIGRVDAKHLNTVITQLSLDDHK
jgi:hypothetical protein